VGKMGTEKANEIHEYYIKLEEIIQQVIEEENNDLKEKLKLKEKENEKLILENNKTNENLIYIYNTDIRIVPNELKIGITKNKNETN